MMKRANLNQNDPRSKNRETIETYNAHNLLLKKKSQAVYQKKFRIQPSSSTHKTRTFALSYSPKGNQTSLTEGGVRTTFGPIRQVVNPNKNKT